MEYQASTQGERLVRLARSVRTAFYGALSPLDYVLRFMNLLDHYPPLHLRMHVGGVHAGFNGSGYELVAYLRLLARLQDGERIWDIGCGCGMLELALEDLGWQGRLIGTDIHKPCIDWARKNIGTRYAACEFVHMDIFNEAYWRKGRLSARQWLDIFGEKGFDVVVAKSLFTHVLPDELDTYLTGIAERLNPGGRALLTFFILSEAQQQLAVAGRNRLLFQPYATDTRCSVRNPMAPTAAVAYDREYLTDRLRVAGFKVDSLNLRPGVWTGAPDGLSFQDIVVVEK